MFKSRRTFSWPFVAIFAINIFSIPDLADSKRAACLLIFDHNEAFANELTVPLFTMDPADITIESILEFDCVVIDVINYKRFLQTFGKGFGRKFLTIKRRLIIITDPSEDLNFIYQATGYFSNYPQTLAILTRCPDCLDQSLLYDANTPWQAIEEHIRSMSQIKNNFITYLLHKGRLTFQNDEIRVSNFHYPPFSIKEGQSITGVEVNVMKAVAHSMSLEVLFYDPTDGQKWGEYGNDFANFTGGFGEVFRGQANVGMGQYFLLSSRLKRFDMHYYDTDRFCLLIKRPPPVPNWTAVIRPFDPYVWTALGLSVILIVLFIVKWLRINPEPEMEPSSSAIYICGAILSQTLPHLPRKDQTRFIVATILLFGLILSSVYKGKILAFLMVEVKPEPLNRIFDLLSHPPDIASHFNFLLGRLEFVSGPEYDKLEEKLRAIGDIDQDFSSVEQGQLIIGDSMRSLQFQVRHRFVDRYGQTQMHIMNECWSTLFTSFLTRKNSPFSPILSRKIRLLIEAGLVDKWIVDEMDKVAFKDNFRKKSISNIKQLSLEHVQTILILLTIGLTLSMLTFAYEYCGKRQEHKSMFTKTFIVKEYDVNNYS